MILLGVMPELVHHSRRDIREAI